MHYYGLLVVPKEIISSKFINFEDWVEGTLDKFYYENEQDIPEDSDEPLPGLFDYYKIGGIWAGELAKRRSERGNSISDIPGWGMNTIPVSEHLKDLKSEDGERHLAECYISKDGWDCADAVLEQGIDYKELICQLLELSFKDDWLLIIDYHS